MITLSDGTASVTISPALQWVDEFAWSPVSQQVDLTITGALVIQEARQQYGRPITLQAPSEDAGWMTLAQVKQLRAWVDTADKVLTLNMRGSSYHVRFRHKDGAIDARPVVEFDLEDLLDTDFFRVVIRLMVTA